MKVGDDINSALPIVEYILQGSESILLRLSLTVLSPRAKSSPVRKGPNVKKQYSIFPHQLSCVVRITLQNHLAQCYLQPLFTDSQENATSGLA